jgi:16S rRNA (uracil1498-N3)-methyltransferase
MNEFQIPSNINCFYVPALESDLVSLPEVESKHAVKALRLRPNDKLLLTNGKGTLAEAIIIEANPKETLLEIAHRYEIPQIPYSLHLALSPLQHPDRFEWFIEKAVELGIQQITPIICKRTEKKKINSERLNKICIAALKQSRQAYLPQINSLCDIQDFIKNVRSANKGIAVCEGNRIPLKQWFKNTTDTQFAVLVGPEGDFTPEETKLAVEHNFTPLLLGDSILRSETAALYIAAGFRMEFL